MWSYKLHSYLKHWLLSPAHSKWWLSHFIREPKSPYWFFFATWIPSVTSFFFFFLCLTKWLSLLVTIFSPYWIQILEAAFRETLLLCATFSEFSPRSRFNRPPSSWAQFGSEKQYCLVVKSHWRLAVWVPVSECPLPSWVALGRLFNLAVPQFPNL